MPAWKMMEIPGITIWAGKRSGGSKGPDRVVLHRPGVPSWHSIELRGDATADRWSLGDHGDLTREEVSSLEALDGAQMVVFMAQARRIP